LTSTANAVTEGDGPLPVWTGRSRSENVVTTFSDDDISAYKRLAWCGRQSGSEQPPAEPMWRD
jgi:hypothetical protein